jgi:MATE family multidrug resistance protein
MISSGISIAVSIRVGAGLGAKSKQRILLSTYVGMGIVLVFESLSFGGFVIGREYLAQLFTIDPEVMAIAPTLMILMGLFQLPDGIQVVWLGALRGLLDVKLPTYIVLFAYTGVCLPLAYLLAFTFGFGTKGIWFGLVIGLLISAILNSFRFFWFTKRLRFEEETVQATL